MRACLAIAALALAVLTVPVPQAQAGCAACDARHGPLKRLKEAREKREAAAQTCQQTGPGVVAIAADGTAEVLLPPAPSQ